MPYDVDSNRDTCQALKDRGEIVRNELDEIQNIFQALHTIDDVDTEEIKDITGKVIKPFKREKPVDRLTGAKITASRQNEVFEKMKLKADNLLA